MSGEHWNGFKSVRLAGLDDTPMPIDANELDRRRRREGREMSSIKALFCCLSVLVGKPAIGGAKDREAKRQAAERGMAPRHQSHYDDDASFGYNFDDAMSPRILSRLASGGHNFN